MKPAPFAYLRPQTLAEALELLATHDDARVLAGGQSLVPLMAMRLSTPEQIVDLNAIEELVGVEREGEVLSIGAMTRQRDVELSDEVAGVLPILPRAIGHIGHPSVRHRGTIGGSLAHADPAAELPAVMVALDAEFEIAGPLGARRISAADFFQGYLHTAIEPGEILVRVHVALGGLPTTWAIREFARRAGDFAIAGAIAGISRDARGVVTDARLVPLGVQSRPRRVTEAEAVLIGAPLDQDTIDAAAAAVVGQVSPSDDIHGSASYKQAMAAEMVRRALRATMQEVSK